MTKKRVPFKQSDLWYRKRKIEPRPDIKAVWITIMDTSGSMIKERLVLTRAFSWGAVKWLRGKYPFVETVFIAHHAEALEEPPKDFFRREGSGGTHFSSGYELALEIIRKRYPSNEYNIYVVHATDGENENGDTPKALGLLKELCKMCNLVGFLEVHQGSGAVSDTFKKISELTKTYPNLKAFVMAYKSEVKNALREFLKEEAA